MPSRTILLVEDNTGDVALTKRALEQGHIADQPVVTDDGQEAPDYLFAPGPFANRDPFDVPSVTLLDLKLPKVPGLEVLRRIRAHTALRRVPVVILTSSKEDQDLATGYDLGVNSYIRKPVDFKQFTTAIRQLGLYWLVMNEPPPPSQERSE